MPIKKQKTSKKKISRKRSTKSTKVYVLDTSALLQDPACLTNYPNSITILPVTVLGELDKHKSRMDAVGKNAREIPRILNKNKGDFLKGVVIGDNTTIKFDPENNLDIPDSLDKNKADNRILGVCNSLKKNKNYKVHLVTNDLYLGLKAQVFGIEVLEFKGTGLLKVFDYKGYRIVQETSKLSIDKLYEKKEIKAPKTYKFKENEYVIIKRSVEKTTAIGRYNSGKLYLVDSKIRCNKITPRNLEQTCLMDLLFNPEIPLVTITGLAGGGKTLIGIACGIDQVLGRDPIYKKLVVSRSLELLSGRDKLGYLKGGLDEKLAPFILPLRDAIDKVLGDKIDGFDYLKNKSRKLEVEPLQYIRGRSINDVYFVVDEVQNLSKADVKTIVTRMGEGSKIILLGDLDQIDNSYLTKKTNGLAQVIEKFKNSKLAGHIELKRGVRSDLASEAADLL